MNLSKYDFILLISPHSYKSPSGKFTTGFVWQISTSNNNFTVTFNEHRIYGLRSDADKAARKFAEAYKYRIKD